MGDKHSDSQIPLKLRIIIIVHLLMSKIQFMKKEQISVGSLGSLVLYGEVGG